MVFYMFDVLRYFKNMTNNEIEKVAFETAMLSKTGIFSNQTGLKPSSILKVDFLENKMLYYYYYYLV